MGYTNKFFKCSTTLVKETKSNKFTLNSTIF